MFLNEADRKNDVNSMTYRYKKLTDKKFIVKTNHQPYNLKSFLKEK